MQDDGFDVKVLLAALEHITAKCVDSGLLCVVNLSIGLESKIPIDMDPESVAVTKAIKGVVAKGIVAVASAMNNKDENTCRNQYLAEPSVIMVGATDKQDVMAWFSNFGPCVDVYAPGTEIKSAGIKNPTSNDVMDGTSMASPRKFSCSQFAHAIEIIVFLFTDY